MILFRELTGWLLVAGGLYLVRMTVGFVTDRQAVQAWIIGLAALGLIRAGILLIRVATAARICMRRLPPEA